MIVYKMKIVVGVQWRINVLKEMIKVLQKLVVIFIVIVNVMEDNAINIKLVQ
jgi:hypothetical protein